MPPTENQNQMRRRLRDRSCSRLFQGGVRNATTVYYFNGGPATYQGGLYTRSAGEVLPVDAAATAHGVQVVACECYAVIRSETDSPAPSRLRATDALPNPR